MSDDLAFLDATAQAELVRKGDVTPIELVDAAITRIEQKMLALGEREIDSRRLGEMVMEELRKLDKVAYIRFASVYKSFSDVDDFRDAIREVKDTK